MLQYIIVFMFRLVELHFDLTFHTFIKNSTENKKSRAQHHDLKQLKTNIMLENCIPFITEWEDTTDIGQRLLRCNEEPNSHKLVLPLSMFCNYIDKKNFLGSEKLEYISISYTGLTTWTEKYLKPRLCIVDSGDKCFIGITVPQALEKTLARVFEVNENFVINFKIKMLNSSDELKIMSFSNICGKVIISTMDILGHIRPWSSINSENLFCEKLMRKTRFLSFLSIMTRLLEETTLVPEVVDGECVYQFLTYNLTPAFILVNYLNDYTPVLEYYMGISYIPNNDKTYACAPKVKLQVRKDIIISNEIDSDIWILECINDTCSNMHLITFDWGGEKIKHSIIPCTKPFELTETKKTYFLTFNMSYKIHMDNPLNSEISLVRITY
ncbi:hypothetical protein CDIK_0870, partial [Cucumispora dikerogammari]